jgi:hypothetical protein
MGMNIVPIIYLDITVIKAGHAAARRATGAPGRMLEEFIFGRTTNQPCLVIAAKQPVAGGAPVGGPPQKKLKRPKNILIK